MKSYAIWYMRPEWFREGIMGAKPDPANLGATHIHLKDLPSEGSLESVFAEMQGERWSPRGEARPLIESKGLAHTSMSVGDVAVVDGEAHLVAFVGFEKLKGEEPRGFRTIVFDEEGAHDAGTVAPENLDAFLRDKLGN